MPTPRPNEMDTAASAGFFFQRSNGSYKYIYTAKVN